MNDSLWTFLFEIANFAALGAVLAWLFFKPVRQAIENRRNTARRNEEEAAQALADAERLRQDIASQHQALATDLETMQTKARDSAKRQAAQIVAEARAQIERERATLKREALHIEQAQTAKIGHAMAAAMHSTMQRFLEQMDGPELEQLLLKAACRELATISNHSLAPVVIESAIALDDESKQLISASLGSAADTANFRVIPELDGGLRISTAHGLIDASSSGLANFAKQSLSAELESMLREDT